MMERRLLARNASLYNKNGISGGNSLDAPKNTSDWAQQLELPAAPSSLV